MDLMSTFDFVEPAEPPLSLSLARCVRHINAVYHIACSDRIGSSTGYIHSHTQWGLPCFCTTAAHRPFRWPVVVCVDCHCTLSLFRLQQQASFFGYLDRGSGCSQRWCARGRRCSSVTGKCVGG